MDLEILQGWRQKVKHPESSMTHRRQIGNRSPETSCVISTGDIKASDDMITPDRQLSLTLRMKQHGTGSTSKQFVPFGAMEKLINGFQDALITALETSDRPLRS